MLTMEVEADATREWPAFAGVGGLSRAALRDSAPDSAQTARTEVRHCADTALTARAGTVAARSFPFAAVLAHYQAVGRHHADPALVTDLWRLHAALERTGFRQLDEGWLLAHWLPATFDRVGGTYDSFLGQPLFAHLRRDWAHRGGEIEDAIDTIVLTCAADLVLHESQAVDVAGDQRRQRARAYAGIQAMLRLAEQCAEVAGLTDDLEKVRVAIIGAASTPDLGTVGRDAATLVLERMPTVIRYVVDVSTLPVTRLHDELMFLRSVQMFEGLYEQTARRMQRAGQALLAGDDAGALEHLATATTKLQQGSALYRVLTGMPKDVFEVFRGLTDGRSANQSRGFRWVEQSSSPRETVTVPARAKPLILAGPTLQECYQRAAGRFGADRLEPVARAMRLLDETWCGMKKTHWGITLKIIGQVPGTGGTAGASYLQRSAANPLFPLLLAEGR